MYPSACSVQGQTPIQTNTHLQRQTGSRPTSGCLNQCPKMLSASQLARAPIHHEPTLSTRSASVLLSRAYTEDDFAPVAQVQIMPDHFHIPTTSNNTGKVTGRIGVGTSVSSQRRAKLSEEEKVVLRARDARRKRDERRRLKDTLSVDEITRLKKQDAVRKQQKRVRDKLQKQTSLNVESSAGAENSAASLSSSNSADLSDAGSGRQSTDLGPARRVTVSDVSNRGSTDMMGAGWGRFSGNLGTLGSINSMPNLSRAALAALGAPNHTTDMTSLRSVPSVDAVNMPVSRRDSESKESGICESVQRLVSALSASEWESVERARHRAVPSTTTQYSENLTLRKLPNVNQVSDGSTALKRIPNVSQSAASMRTMSDITRHEAGRNNGASGHFLGLKDSELIFPGFEIPSSIGATGTTHQQPPKKEASQFHTYQPYRRPQTQTQLPSPLYVQTHTNSHPQTQARAQTHTQTQPQQPPRNQMGFFSQLSRESTSAEVEELLLRHDIHPHMISRPQSRDSGASLEYGSNPPTHERLQENNLGNIPSRTQTPVAQPHMYARTHADVRPPTISRTNTPAVPPHVHTHTHTHTYSQVGVIDSPRASPQAWHQLAPLEPGPIRTQETVHAKVSRPSIAGSLENVNSVDMLDNPSSKATVVPETQGNNQTYMFENPSPTPTISRRQSQTDLGASDDVCGAAESGVIEALEGSNPPVGTSKGTRTRQSMTQEKRAEIRARDAKRKRVERAKRKAQGIKVNKPQKPATAEKRLKDALRKRVERARKRMIAQPGNADGSGIRSGGTTPYGGSLENLHGAVAQPPRDPHPVASAGRSANGNVREQSLGLNCPQHQRQAHVLPPPPDIYAHLHSSKNHENGADAGHSFHKAAN